EIRNQETTTTLTASGAGVYVYKNEAAVKDNTAGITINVVEDVQENFETILNDTTVQALLNTYLTANVTAVEVKVDANGDTVFVITKDGALTEVNITELIRDNTYVATLELTENTSNAEGVQAGFTFHDGKNATVATFAETLTKVSKGQDSNQQIAYSYIDETGVASTTQITVTQDIIDDFGKVLADDTVKALLQQFIASAQGDVAVVRLNGDLIIQTATEEFNLSEEIRNQETTTTLTASGAGVYVYKNEAAVKDNTAGITINVVEDVLNNFETIIESTEVQNLLSTYLTKEFDGNVTYKNGDFYVTTVQNNTSHTEKLELKTMMQESGESILTDGVIGVKSNGGVGTEVEKAVLKSFTLSLNENMVTTNHIQDGTIQVSDLAEAGANQVLVTGADKKPVWKEQAKVTPQFFYMPAVIFDTSVAGTATRDLYGEYVNQFTGGSRTSSNSVSYPISHGPAGTTPMMYGGGIVGSTGAPADITVFENDELYYYVTYYDEEVFENLSISADGKLTYTVKSGATSSSYMNIVFVIK
ncbi:hypothetical protein ACPDG4_13365, partial [Myroides sp. C20-1]